MKIARTFAELRALRSSFEAERNVGFVPTMGSLHEGHLSLVREARTRCAIVVVSIFVNPLQFGPNEDFRHYPRDEGSDLQLLENESVDVAFLPAVDEMYPEGRATTVSVGALSKLVEGESRPGHFDGVATVVAKLFNLVRPDIALFGQKDVQQLAVIRKMVDDLGFPIEIVGCPTIRERDGLAMSSRNVYLDPDERQRATALYRSLEAGRATFLAGEDSDAIEKVMWETSASTPGVDVDYAQIVDPKTFERPTQTSSALLVIAARVGNTRLIDNVLVTRQD